MYRKDRKKEFYTTLAKKEGYPARSVYKLKEIDERYKIIKKNSRVLDLGCAPGSWLLYISQKVGNKGKVIGVDIEEIKIPQKANIVFIKRSAFDLERPEVDELRSSSPFANARIVDEAKASSSPSPRFWRGSVVDEAKASSPPSSRPWRDLVFKDKFEVVVSDLSPKTSGIKFLDTGKSLELAEKSFEIAKSVLLPGGNFVCKIFEGESSDAFFKKVKNCFDFAKRFKPKAVIRKSKEFYIIGMGFRV
jgi:23S rRNA (uridine2552-2'-O)-methyltransferase